jgi:hypothetical protein
VYLTSANVLFLSSFALNEINKLRVISAAQNSDSPRLHHFKYPSGRVVPRPGDPQVLGWMCMKAATDWNDIAPLPGGNASRSARKFVSLDFVKRGGAQSSTQGLSI